MLIFGYFILIGFPLIGLILILRQYGKQLDAERDDALIRAVNAYESPHDFSSDDCLGMAFGNYQPGRPLPPKPVEPAPVPAVFRRRRAGLWAFGGNAHQRRVFRRSIERAAA